MIEQAGDRVVIAGAELLAQAYRAVLDGIARRRRDGMPTADLLQLARALRAAHSVSLECRELDDSSTNSAGSKGQDRADLISVAEAAHFLQLSKRQVQRIAGSPGGPGVRAGRTWKLAKAPVLALAERRARDRSGRLPGELASARRPHT